MVSSLRIPLFILIVSLILSACGVASRASASGKSRISAESHATSVAMTYAVLGTQAALSPGEFQTAIYASPQPAVATPSPTASATASLPAGVSASLVLSVDAPNARVLEDALCYRRRGRGGVISAVKKDERILLIGQYGGWWAIVNPLYLIPCWVKKSSVRVDAGFDTSSLPVYDVVPLMDFASTPKP